MSLLVTFSLAGREVDVNTENINNVSKMGETTWIRMKNGENIYVDETQSDVKNRIDEAEITRAVKIAQRIRAPSV
mgnify:CR=1 FL=1